nr:SRPBCC family protein [Pseudonocardia acidicola]
MAHAERSIIIDRPIEAVFDHVADGNKNPQWRRHVMVACRISSQTGQGAIYRQLLRGPVGRPVAGDYRVTAFSPPHRLDFEVIAGPVRPTGSFRLTEARPGSTTIRFVLDLQPRDLARPASNRMIINQLRGDVAALTALKACLERR